jgi:hypothetical protein
MSAYRRSSLVVLALMLGADRTTLAADRPAWAMSPEEHLAVRQGYVTAQLQAAAKQPTPNGAVIQISGATSPGAFLPSELFGALVRRAFGESPNTTIFRQALEQRTAALGFGAGLWPQLAKIVQPVLDSQQRQRAIGAELAAKSLEESPNLEQEQIAECALRAKALRRAERKFGEQAFRRLLYEGFAPLHNIATTENDAKQLLYVERGCR